MESQRQRRQFRTQKQKVNNTNCYVSFIASGCVNTFILIILALVYSDNIKTTKPQLIISFNNNEEVVDLDHQEIILEDLSPQESIGPNNNDIAFSPIRDDDSDTLSIEADQILDHLYTSSSRYETQPTISDINKKISNHKDSFDIGVVDSVSGNSTETKVSGRDGLGGAGQEIDRRLKLAGAKTGDIQISIAWDNYNDIDVWLEYKDNRKYSNIINWMNRSVGKGFLDIDMNYKPQTNRAVENICWEKDEAPFGLYNVYIHHYHRWEPNIDSTVVNIKIVFDNKVVYKRCTIKISDGPVKIFTYNRLPTKELLAKKQKRNELKELHGPFSFGPLGYTPDDIVIEPAPIFR